MEEQYSKGTKVESVSFRAIGATLDFRCRHGCAELRTD